MTGKRKSLFPNNTTQIKITARPTPHLFVKMTNPHTEKIIVGMSGGVASSVSAILLKQQGYKVEGLFMKTWEEDDTEEYCSATVDLAVV